MRFADGAFSSDKLVRCYLAWATRLIAIRRAFNTLVGEMTPYLQEVIEWRLYFMHGFFCGCSFVLGP